jgi:hypothetical protein
LANFDDASRIRMIGVPETVDGLAVLALASAVPAIAPRRRR